MRTTLRGIRWAGSGYIATQALNLLAYLVLVRLLTPHAFGLYAAGTVITGIGGLFAESGMLAALIKREDRLEEAASTAFAALAVSGLGLTLGSAALAPVVGLAFHSAQVGEITAVLSGWLMVRALTIVPDALLQRRFSFLRRVLVDPLGVVAYAAVAIPLATAGAGVWAMVGGAYASIVVEAVAAWLASGFRPRLRLMSMAMYRELASFTRPLVVGEVVRRLTMYVDVFMLGRFGSAAVLGQYRNGQLLANQPGGIFGQVTAYVILPAFARLSTIPHRITAAARRAYWAAYTLIFPMSFALVPLGVPLAVTVLGERWRPAGHALAALSGMLLGNTLMSITSELMKATGALRFQLRVQIAGLAVIVATVVPGALVSGLLGVAIAVSFSSCITVAYAMSGVCRQLGLPWRELVVDMLAPAGASLVMAGAMLVFQDATLLVDNSEPVRILLLVCDLLVGAVVYIAAVAVVDAPRREAMRRALRRLQRRVRPQASPAGS